MTHSRVTPTISTTTAGTTITGGDSRRELGTPLQGIKVVEVGHAVSAPLCARHLADLGADVVKIEAPSGDLARGYDSVVSGDSAYFAWANYGKRSVVLDLRSEDGRAHFEQFVGRADVLVHNLGPGAMNRLGFDSDHLAALNPQLVNCQITGYGSTGPMAERKAFDLLVQGESGLMAVTGTEDRPVKVGISVVDMCTAMYALAAVQAALFDRSSTGAGRYVEISMLDCISEWMMVPAFHQIHADSTPRREGARHNMMVPYGVYRTGVGTSVNFAIQTTSHWQSLCDVLEAPELAEHPDFATNADRVRNRATLEPRIEELLTGIGHDEAVRRLLASAIPCGEVNDLQGLVDHPQLAARERWMSIRTRGGVAPTVRSPFNLRNSHQPSPAVPGLGEHTDAVLAELSEDDTAPNAVSDSSRSESTPSGPPRSESKLPSGNRNGEHHAS
ncbi:CaiB/BaiF CoA-transferase family protein [Actinomadura vinacea]|uniref:CaiB/BaiF CoA-transferase family protein n=1 Tax=Actinomadura vinacea TaxID=115336 RepID=A0ABN3IBY1_9ACTN